jgi:hypothetical protein
MNKNNNIVFYLSLVIHWRFVKRIEEQMKSFMKGFNEIVPTRCILLFDPKELEVTHLFLCLILNLHVY